MRNHTKTLRENCPNTEFFLVCIFLYSVQIQENTDQEKLRIWTFFMQWELLLIRTEDSVHQRHVHALVTEVFNSLNNINPEFTWYYFTFKHVAINVRNRSMLKLPITNSTRIGFKSVFLGICLLYSLLYTTWILSKYGVFSRFLYYEGKIRTRKNSIFGHFSHSKNLRYAKRMGKYWLFLPDLPR